MAELDWERITRAAATPRGISARTVGPAIASVCSARVTGAAAVGAVGAVTAAATGDGDQPEEGKDDERDSQCAHLTP